jgi:hypothetical protein
MIPKSGYRFLEKDHAPAKTWSGMTIRRKGIPLQGSTLAGGLIATMVPRHHQILA